MFQWGDNIIAIIFNAPIKNEENCRALYIQQVFPAYTPPIMLRHTTGPQFNMCIEKDWSPIGPAKEHSVDYAEGFLFAYSIEPTHRVIRCHLTGSCETVASTDSSAILKSYQQLFSMDKYSHAGKIKLGTNAVRIDQSYYGSILHFVIPHFPPMNPVYHNIPYIFESNFPYRITKVAIKSFEFPSPDNMTCGFMYATGLTFVQGKLGVTYTCEESTASLYLGTVDGIFQDMIDVSQLKVDIKDLPSFTSYRTSDTQRKKMHCCSVFIIFSE